ncbi:uncharacterized protein LOC115743039 [Rhodamnia argentea]|uniref:Uncharacterized protein LOC115743039 n=1 Tax=Rhodamnia argentea TaxID=178133 RepID=A0A8B8PG81_9MYRT|nr:uncharacterized protein LOC115743039 [Rhodamnia argentea]
MSLNCLTCQAQRRVDLDLDYGCVDHEEPRHLCCVMVDRNWSGPLASPSYEKKISRSGLLGPRTKKAKKGQRRLWGTGASSFGDKPMAGSGEARLVRSSGMRRDWSFEDLRKRRDEKSKSRR